MDKPLQLKYSPSCVNAYRTTKKKQATYTTLKQHPQKAPLTALARIDRKRYRDIIFANQKHIVDEHAEPFYTNSSQLPVDFSGDLFEALEHQETLQTLYTGGTNFHIFLGERLPSWKSAAELIKKVSWNSKLPYFTLTPTFSVCPTHGYMSGEHKTCPVCGIKLRSLQPRSGLSASS